MRWLLAGLLTISLTASANDDDLLMLMGTLQTLTHKLQLSLDADNGPLAGFYVHELEEVGEAVVAVESYHGHPIGALAGAMLMPQIAAVDASLEGAEADLTATRQAFEQLVVNCNACHAATGHGFIVIERNDANPYLQSFAPR
ncbi:MAG: hypothetical protein ACNA7W_21830 [Pseudomonadales bacterium]